MNAPLCNRVGYLLPDLCQCQRWLLLPLLMVRSCSHLELGAEKGLQAAIHGSDVHVLDVAWAV